MTRPGAAALALLVTLVTVQLGDAGRGGDAVGTPTLLLGTALAGLLVGVTMRPLAALPVVVAAAAALTWAHQLADPGAYPVLDDFMFALFGVGAPALGGAVVRVRAAQVRELRQAVDLLQAQRETEVRAARLEERNRLQVRLHSGFSEQVAAIAMRAESAVGADDEAVRRALVEVETAARQGLDELRTALGTLHDEPKPSAVEPARPLSESTADVPPLGPPDLALAATIATLVAVECAVSPQAEGPVLLNVLVALLTAAPLVVRRHRPIAACALTVGGFLVMAGWLTPPTAMVTPILPVLVCGYVVGAHVGGPRRLLGLVVVLAGSTLLAWVGGDLSEPGAVVPVLVFVVIAALIGTIVAGRHRRAEELGAVVDELEHGRDVAVGLAVAEQRSRLAGELHDTVAHAMTVICLQASAGQVKLDPARLDSILTAARSSLQELRDGLDHLGDDTELGVAGLTAQARRSGLRPRVRVVGPVDQLPAATRRLAARLVREALTNASRYAPGSVVRVTVEATDSLQLSVADEGPDGPALTDLGAGTGLAALADEVSREGGTMTWGPAGSGFQVTATLPGVEVLV